MFLPWSPMDISFYQQLQLSPPSSPKHPALCYYPGYPSPPFATDDGFGNHVPEAHTAIMTDNPWPPPPPPPPPKVDGGERVVVARKDKHSKICTAGGMRDRRMRLSLDVAGRFFALQDKLGFDKASKTVQWLLHMSRAGIKELMVSKDGSSLSDTTQQHDEHQITMDSDSDKKNKRRPIKALIKRAATRKQATRKPSNAASSPISIDKESRARARERARERTKERNRLRWATLASSISIEEAPSSRHLNMASQVEDVIPSSEHHSSYYHQDQWELSGVVFAKARTLPLIE